MSSNAHDVVRRLQPGHVVSWRDDSGRRAFDYVGFMAPNKLIYTTATELNEHVPQTMTLTEFANYLDNIAASLFLATNWEVQDVAFANPVPPVTVVGSAAGRAAVENWTKNQYHITGRLNLADP